MSSKYIDVLDDIICNRYPCIIYFWKPQDKSNWLVVTPGIMIIIRKIRMIRNVLQVPRMFLMTLLAGLSRSYIPNCPSVVRPLVSDIKLSASPFKDGILLANTFKMPTCYIFLETSGQIQLTGGDSRYHDHHQEDQDDQECPPSTRMFLMTLFAIDTHVSYIFGNLRTNPVDRWWLQVSWSPSGRSGWSGMSSKYQGCSWWHYLQ